jgi:acetyl-CoA carboxylase biotin carboxyl carrier protein
VLRARHRYLCGVDAQQIKAFIDVMATSDLVEMEFSQDGWTLRLVRRGAAVDATHGADAFAPPAVVVADPAPSPPDAPASSESNELKAPLFGIVHLQRSPGDPPFVAVGQAVKAGQTVCVVEAMKVFNEVLADRDATVAAVLVASGQEVEADQPLLRFER